MIQACLFAFFIKQMRIDAARPQVQVFNGQPEVCSMSFRVRAIRSLSIAFAAGVRQ
jgi:hypothetical protein